MNRVAIVASRWNESVTSRLVQGALSALSRSGIPTDQIDVLWVHGAFEIPQAVSTVASTKKYNAIVPVGCLIRGETSHFDFIARSVTQGLDQTGRASGVAVSFGILTVDTLEQGLSRAGGKFGNKGEEAALAALALAGLMKEARG